MTSDPHARFDALARRSPKDGSACWSARELCPVLGYARWESFVAVIKRAVEVCKTENNDDARHFQECETSDAEGGARPQRDFRLTRYACHLIAMNGDARREAVAAARVFFEKKKERPAPAAKPAAKAKPEPKAAAKPAGNAAEKPAPAPVAKVEPKPATKLPTKPLPASGSRFIPQAGGSFYGSTHQSRNSRWNPNCAVSRGYPNSAARTSG